MISEHWISRISDHIPLTTAGAALGKLSINCLTHTYNAEISAFSPSVVTRFLQSGAPTNVFWSKFKQCFILNLVYFKESKIKQDKSYLIPQKIVSNCIQFLHTQYQAEKTTFWCDFWLRKIVLPENVELALKFAFQIIRWDKFQNLKFQIPQISLPYRMNVNLNVEWLGLK